MDSAMGKAQCCGRSSSTPLGGRNPRMWLPVYRLSRMWIRYAILKVESSLCRDESGRESDVPPLERSPTTETALVHMEVFDRVRSCPEWDHRLCEWSVTICFLNIYTQGVQKVEDQRDSGVQKVEDQRDCPQGGFRRSKTRGALPCPLFAQYYLRAILSAKFAANWLLLQFPWRTQRTSLCSLSLEEICSVCITALLYCIGVNFVILHRCKGRRPHRKPQCLRFLPPCITSEDFIYGSWKVPKYYLLFSLGE
jgi:hypothetical protein